MLESEFNRGGEEKTESVMRGKKDVASDTERCAHMTCLTYCPSRGGGARAQQWGGGEQIVRQELRRMETAEAGFEARAGLS